MISVCIASYNGSQFIKEQLESILPQLSLEDEVIISDDGSSDGTLEKITDDMVLYGILKMPYGIYMAIMFFLATKMIFGNRIKLLNHWIICKIMILLFMTRFLLTKKGLVLRKDIMNVCTVTKVFG